METVHSRNVLFSEDSSWFSASLLSTHTTGWHTLLTGNSLLYQTIDWVTPLTHPMIKKQKNSCLEYMDCHPIKHAADSCSLSPDSGLSSSVIDPKASSPFAVCIGPATLHPLTHNSWLEKLLFENPLIVCMERVQSARPMKGDILTSCF